MNQSYRDLRVWQESHKLATEIYILTGDGISTFDTGLKAQLREASLKIAVSIASGHGRGNHQEFTDFLYRAKDHLSELRVLLELAEAMGFIKRIELIEKEKICNKLYGMLTRFILFRDNQIKQNPSPRIQGQLAGM